MNHSPDQSIGPSELNGHWDGLSTIERVLMILDHADHFLLNGLVTRQELLAVTQISETEMEYIINREEQPLFTRINIKKEIRTQCLRDQLKTALAAVFL
jgi:hypothetical protein